MPGSPSFSLGSMPRTLDKRTARTPTDPVEFGPFRLFAAARVLEKDGLPLEIGSRALDILIVLVAHANDVVTKKELLAKVWRGLRVEEGSLRFHVSVLRKALGDGQTGARYIVNVSGRGYCFVASLSHVAVNEPATAAFSVDHRAKLPPLLTRMIGRAADVSEISAKLATDRFVTVVGAGGIGKTTVAVAVSHAMLESFDGMVYFADLGAITDPALVPSAFE